MSGNIQQSQDSFASGVIEGFYGMPWSLEQRIDLFKKLQKWDMNCYLYAPKDDYKHRSFWRELYSDKEAKEISSLITEAHRCNIKFYYAIAPGLDITYSDPKEISLLKKKLEQIKSLGCTAFAILFDDIEIELQDADMEAFGSFAQAQVMVTNEVYKHFGGPKFMFCPTEYCSTRAIPNIQESKYLNTVGSTLESSIDILWTGPLVVSKTITCDHIKQVGSVLRRPPVIWENLHANDYDQGRLYLGPFSQRSTELIPHLRGFLTNPNCEYGSNFVAIHTLGQWLNICDKEKGNDSNSNQEESQCVYEPRNALLNALKEWLPEFNATIDAFGHAKSSTSATATNDEMMPMSPEHFEASKDDLNRNEELSLSDLELLADLNYLPFEYGKHASFFLEEFKWLKENAYCVIQNALTGKVNTLMDANVKEWHKRADNFSEMTSVVKEMSEKIMNIRNRSLLYDIYSYVSTTKGVIGLLNLYIDWIKSAKFLEVPFSSNYRQLDLWLKRGGVAAELHRMLCDAMKEFSYLENVSKSEQICSTLATNECFIIRPYTGSDLPKLHNFLLRTGIPTDDLDCPVNKLHVKPDIVAQALLEMDFEEKVITVVEDEKENLQGFSLLLRHGEKSPLILTQYLETVKISNELHVPPPPASNSISASFPSYLMIRVHPFMKNFIPKRLLSLASDALRKQGSSGISVPVKSEEKALIKLYTSLGFKEAEEIEGYKFLTFPL